MEQKWFEMAEIRKRRYNDVVWIPLRAGQTVKSGKWGQLGFREEFFGAGSLAIPLRKREVGEKLTWSDLGLMRDHCGYAHRGRYMPADELGARRMAIRLSWYRQRQAVMETEPDFKWPEPTGSYKDGERWEGRISAIHEGGEPFGESMAVLHVMRTNLDFDEDVPRIGISDESTTSSFTRKLSEGRKLYRVAGEVWRNEWVEPA